MNETTPVLPFTLKEKLASLRQKLEENNPGYASVLSEIHSLTKQNPDFVYALTDEEFQTIISGLGRYTQITLETEKTKKKGMSAKEGMLLSEDSV